MSLSPVVAEWVATHEQKYGKRPSEQSIQIAQHIENVGEKLRKNGRSDAQIGEAARPAAKFVELARFAFRNSPDAETAQIIGDLWQSDYMDGYTK